ncbi:exopolysaccharide biosynthesis protein [uncultured Roseivirga sp.]|uniref:exopolysaccharide biosynthesis protein n=1 Tax=uncultured Roseivirga sp. TaxID=543088 RepID=UPI0030DA948D|tara:strand:- start:73495 stop:74577 length:1083 start_codon:yes stop_codon:yes gene_type:complete
MMDKANNSSEENITLAVLVQRIKNWIAFMFSAWKRILLGTLFIGAVFFLYQFAKKNSYRAETTFVLESEGGGIGGQLSSLANLTGINLGSMSEGSGLFQIDNIIELYRSYRMMRKTLLTEVEVSSKKQRLITHYIEDVKLSKKMSKTGINFEVPDNQIEIRHDSVLKEVVEDILKYNLSVSKPSRKLTILSVAYSSKSQEFSKVFNETLVKHVNEFYLETKTKKSGDNLGILAYQTDSVKRVLDKTLADLAEFEERHPNLNPLRAKELLPYQKLQIDAKASAAVYEELVKNLELAKISDRNNQPLIQVIDEPVLPLKNQKMKWYKALVIGLVIGGVLMVFWVTMSYFYRLALREDKESIE